jgi:Tol biopolymer transport system component
MGEVYRAHDPRLGRDVAIKVLAQAVATDTGRLERFENEARAAAALNHPNILAVYDIGQHNGAPYIVSELLHGQTLRERLTPGTALPVRKAIGIAVQIANGLAAAHEKGIVHRDLKPENIFIGDGDQVKILDFGIAKLTETEAEADAGDATTAKTAAAGTQPGIVMGTVGYMAPEQVRGLTADRRSDIFSFGAILYEMLSGRRAFAEPTVADTMSAILKEHPPELTSIDPRVPPALARLVERCLEKAPVARFQSTRDLAFALAGFAAGPETGSGAHALPPHARISVSPWAAAGIAVLLAAIAGLAALPYFRPAPSEAQTVALPVPPPKDTSAINAAVRMMSISPDGTRLVFPAAGIDGSQRLWLRTLGAMDASVIPGTDDAEFPFWSADGRSLGFFADGKLKKIELGGGTPVSLCDAPQPSGGTWNAADAIVFSSGGRLQRISSAGGSPTTLPGANAGRAGSTFANPLFLPDGRHLLYLDTGAGGVAEAAIYAGAVDSADRVLVLKAASNLAYAQGYLFFLRDTTLMAQPFDPKQLALSRDAIPVAEQVQSVRAGAARGAFAVSNGLLAYQVISGGPVQPTDLTLFDRTGHPLGHLGDRGDYADLKLSPDGKLVALGVLDPSHGRELWTIDVERGVSTRLTFDRSDAQFPTWSPEGRRISYASRRSGHYDVYEKDVSGPGERPILVDSFDKYPQSWSTDGRFLLFTRGSLGVVGGARGSLWVLPAFGDRKPYVLLDAPPFNLYPGQFSADGRWILYTSNESGRSEIYAMAFPGLDHKVRISTAGGNWPRWRHDGKEIFYLALPPDNSLIAVGVNASGADLQVGEIDPMFSLQWKPGARYPYDVLPDGRRFLVASLVSPPPPAPITVVVNWIGLLKK